MRGGNSLSLNESFGFARSASTRYPRARLPYSVSARPVSLFPASPTKRDEILRRELSSRPCFGVEKSGSTASSPMSASRICSDFP
jgi:hypothetical protein